MAGYMVYNIKMYLWEGGKEGGKETRRKGKEREKDSYSGLHLSIQRRVCLGLAKVL